MACVIYNAFGALAFAYESHDTFFQKLGGEGLVWEICWLKVKQMKSVQKGLENFSSEASL